MAPRIQIPSQGGPGGASRRMAGRLPGPLFVLLGLLLYSGIPGGGFSRLHADPASIEAPDPVFQTYSRGGRGETRPFPVQKISDFLRAWASSGQEGYRFDPDYQARLDAILPRGLYHFGPECPLVKLKESDHFQGREIFHFQIQCLPGDLRPHFRISFVSQSSPFPARFLREMAGGREIYGSFTLMERGVHARWYYTLWQTGPIRYANPFLEILQERNPRMTEGEFQRPSLISDAFPEMLGTLEQLQKARARSSSTLRFFYEVVTPGSTLSFTGHCPLTLLSPPGRERGEERYRVHLRLSCLKGDVSYREVQLLLPPGSPELERLRGIKPGTNFAGELIFRGIGGPEGQFHPEWDTIKNIRIPEKREPSHP